MELWFFIGIVAAFLITFGFVPQILKMYGTRSVEDVSLATFVWFQAGVGLWVFYGISIRDPIVTVANIVTFATLVSAIALYCVCHGVPPTSRVIP